jgi:hypothetical protein
MCPYLRVDEYQTNCAAYMGPHTEPSVYEQEYYCGSCSHPDCVWFMSKGKEVIRDPGTSLRSALAGAEHMAGVITHSDM